MTPQPKRLAALAAAALAAALSLAACGGSSPSSSGSSGSAGKPTSGGTLRMVANGGPSNNLDTVSSYQVENYILERVFARQLLSYDTVDVTGTSGASWNKSITLVPDVATVVPSKANGGISSSGLVYTYHLRSGVDWNSNPARPVVADDFIREYKAFCNPVQPVGNVTYFTSTIAGFNSYCNAEGAHFGAKNAPSATAGAISAWQNSHNISGVSAPNPSTLKITLTEPASDFNNIMAMPFDSARPVEYDSYVPGSAQLAQHLMSDGPYQLSSWVPNKTITFTRNPAWKQASDPVRHQYVSKIAVTMGTSSSQTALADMQADTQDMSLDLAVPPTSIPSLEATHSASFHIWPSSNSAYYMLYNLRSPDSGGAMSKLGVRQAIAYAVNKTDIQKILGGASFNKVLSTEIPPGNSGYAAYNPYGTPGNNGEASKCKTMLASAGYPHGFTATYMYTNDTVGTDIFQAVQSALSKCGITLKGRSETLESYFTDLGNSPQNNKPNQWDMATGSWFPDWYGNDGRAVIQPLFQTNCRINTVNDGCYSNKTEDSLISQALKAPSETAAAKLWEQADNLAMKDVVVTPLIDQWGAQYASTRVKSATGDGTANFNEGIFGPDLTNIWLDPNHP
ncbi:MAG TPA: ABC transporter substrate-binding protein [Streptosporangiaceae bacterium]|jgi:peptide/nickel transport system substrate-binding protein